jgi:uncharacterized protein (DUF302 family)
MSPTSSTSAEGIVTNVLLAGTPVMLASPLAALDLPLRVLVAADADSAVTVSYNSPDYLTTRDHLMPGLGSRLEAIDAITDAAASRDR